MKLRSIFREASREVESLLHFEDIANSGLRYASKASNTLDLLKRASEALERDQHPLVNNPLEFEERRKKLKNSKLGHCSKLRLVFHICTSSS